MKRSIIELNSLPFNGKIYHNNNLNTIESLIPSGFTSNHAPDLLELPNGDLLCAWFAGSNEGNADISIALSRLNNESSQWSEPVIISDDSSRSKQNPSLFLNSNGEIWVIYTSQQSRESATNKSFNLQYTSVIRRRISKDNGYSWGQVKTIFDSEGSFCRQKPQVLSNNRWIFGNWICSEDDTRNGSDITTINISDDKGKSWRSVTIPDSRGRVHANIIEIKPGQLIALFRSRAADNIYISNSFNNGDTWTSPVRTILPNNNSSISAIKLKSGRIAIVYNHLRFNNDSSLTVWPSVRCPVTIAISEDNGETWPIRRHIEIGEGFCGEQNQIHNRRYEYPCILQTDDEKIHVAYAFGNRMCMKYVSFDENWILNDEQE